jgi:hypothetical protein
MGNHKPRNRMIHYEGFLITLEYDPGNYLGIASGWVYSLVNEVTGMDYGSSSSRMSFREALSEAKLTVDDILSDAEEYLEETAIFSGNEDYTSEAT